MPTRSRAVDASAITSVLSSTLEGIPHEVQRSGCITISPEATHSQLIQAMRRGYDHGTVTITQLNFFKGDLWNLVASKYRGGMDFMRSTFGEEMAEKMAIHFKNRAHIARYVPEENRVITKPWSYYVKVVAAEGHNRASRMERISDLTVTIGQTSAVFDYAQGGRLRHY